MKIEETNIEFAEEIFFKEYLKQARIFKKGKEVNQKETITNIMNQLPIKSNPTTQKFKRGAKVYICKEMPSMMRHFPSNFNAIIDYSYAQKYGGKDTDNYSLIVLDNNDNPINSIAWYKESQLTLLDNNTKVGLKLISTYYKITKGEK